MCHGSKVPIYRRLLPNKVAFLFYKNYISVSPYILGVAGLENINLFNLGGLGL
jgi:hypothetical protein